MKLPEDGSMKPVIPSEDEENNSDDTEIKEGGTILLSSKFSCPVSDFTIDDIEPKIFSFNTPHGACPHCGGLGKEMTLDLNLVIPNHQLSIAEGAIHPWDYSQQKSSISRYFMQILYSLSEYYSFKLETPWCKLPDKIKNILLYGSGEETIPMTYEENRVKHSAKKPFIGIVPFMNRSTGSSSESSQSSPITKYQSMQNCPKCQGHRLKQESLCVKINSMNIGEVTSLTVAKALEWAENLPKHISKKHVQISEIPLQEVTRRLTFLMHVGLDYLCLNRESHTLSGGESQRIRLASQIGSGLSGVVYVLDEPSVGLHQRDNYKLLRTLKYLRDIGNTVIVVEHDEDTMKHADHIIDVGPKAGINGGYVIAEGTPDAVMHNPNSITGQYLSAQQKIDIPVKRPLSPNQKYIEIIGANLIT